jgi:hypothetical protein
MFYSHNTSTIRYGIGCDQELILSKAMWDFLWHGDKNQGIRPLSKISNKEDFQKHQMRRVRAKKSHGIF